jgi:alanine racemase
LISINIKSKQFFMTLLNIPNSHASAVLTIDLEAVRKNYQILQRTVNSVEIAAVVKANGYGLGADKIGPALVKAGCKKFFVAHLEEGIHLRPYVGSTEIHILGGLLPGANDAYRKHNLIPVLGSLHEILAWSAYTRDMPLPCDIHVDTGMLRLGLPQGELLQIADDPDIMKGLQVLNVISHLASADEFQSNQTSAQLRAFKIARKILPMGKACLANSSGIFCGAPYHFDMVRPGIALYGANPTPHFPNPMCPTAGLKVRISQIRDALPGETVGYGATYKISKNSKIATVSVGYADGYLRSLSNKSFAYLDGHKIPLVGRVSMDLITFDITNVPIGLCNIGAWIELIGPSHSVDDLAKEGSTISYEILTNLGARYHRVYTNE